MSVDIQTFQKNIANKDYITAVVLGCVPGVYYYKKWGYVGNISSAGDIWPNAGNYVFPVAGGQEVEVVSASASDTGSFHVHGIDGTTGLEKDEIITLTGTTPKTLSGLWAAINRAHIDAKTPLVGAVTIRGTGTPNSNVFALISVVDQHTTQCPFLMPSNFIGVVKNIAASLNSSGTADDQVIIRFAVETTDKALRTQVRFGLQRSGTTIIATDTIEPIVIPPSSQVRMLGDPSAIMDISGAYSLLLVEKQLIPPALLESIIDE